MGILRIRRCDVFARGYAVEIAAGVCLRQSRRSISSTPAKDSGGDRCKYGEKYASAFMIDGIDKMKEYTA